MGVIEGKEGVDEEVPRVYLLCVWGDGKGKEGVTGELFAKGDDEPKALAPNRRAPELVDVNRAGGDDGGDWFWDSVLKPEGCTVGKMVAGACDGDYDRMT